MRINTRDGSGSSKSVDPILLTLPGQARHLQTRSRKTASSIVRAARDLIKKRPYDQLSVAEIVAHAGTSVGGFYARFRNKDSLLEVMMAAVTMETRSSLETMVQLVSGKTAIHFVRTWTKATVVAFRTHEVEIREVMKNWPAGLPSDGILARESASVRDYARELFRSELLKRSGEIAHRSPRSAVNVALMMGTVSLREAVIGGAMPGYGIDFTDDKIADEIGDAIVQYLRLKS